MSGLEECEAVGQCTFSAREAGPVSVLQQLQCNAAGQNRVWPRRACQKVAGTVVSKGSIADGADGHVEGGGDQYGDPAGALERLGLVGGANGVLWYIKSSGPTEPLWHLCKLDLSLLPMATSIGYLFVQCSEDHGGAAVSEFRDR